MTGWHHHQGVYRLELSDHAAICLASVDGRWLAVVERTDIGPGKHTMPVCQLNQGEELRNAQRSALRSLLLAWEARGLPLSKGELDAARVAIAGLGPVVADGEAA